MLIAAIVLITSALVFYTAGVFAERRSGVLKPWHAALFGIGLVGDATGTYLMTQIAQSGSYATDGAASLLTTLMAITGVVALVLMGAHLAWALLVLWKGSDAARRTFHKLSVAVWGVWLVPYFTGLTGAMIR